MLGRQSSIAGAAKAPNINTILPSRIPRRWNQRRPHQTVFSVSPFEPDRTIDVEAQPATSQGEGAPTLHGPASPAAESLMSAINSAVKEEQYKAEAIRQRLLGRLRGLRSGAPQSPAAVGEDEPHDDEAASTAAAASLQSEAEGGDDLKDQRDAIVRAPWLTWLLALVTAAVFAVQWAPLLPVLLDGAKRADPGTLLAFLLVLPDTSWKMVRMQLQWWMAACRLAERPTHGPCLPVCRMS